MLVDALGVAFVIIGVGLPIVWAIQDRPGKGAVALASLIAIFAGALLFLRDRIVELTVENVGTLKAAAVQATSDAQAISELRERIETQAATVDLVANSAHEAKKLGEAVASQLAQAEARLTELDSLVAQANERVARLDQFSNFSTTVIAAQSDDRQAYDQLYVWSGDANFPLRDQARQAWVEILNQSDKGLYREGSTVPWKEGVDPTSLSLESLKREFANSNPQMREALLEYIWRREDFPKRERMAFLYEVIRDDKSLRVVARAARYFDEGADLGLKPLAIPAYLEWWEKNASTFNWGTTPLERAQ